MQEYRESTGAEAAAVAFEAAAAELEDFLTNCSEEEWRRFIPGEERAVGVLAYHMTAGMPTMSGWLECVHTGSAVPGTAAGQDDDNAAEALEHANTTPGEVLALLNANLAPAAAAIRSLTSEEMDSVIAFGPAGGAELPVRQLAGAAERHLRRHLGNIRAALATSS